MMVLRSSDPPAFFAGLATLLTSEWEYQRAEPIDIYGSGVEALVKGAIDYLTPNAEIRWAEGKKRLHVVLTADI